jgi:gluconolactonase
MTNWGRWVRMGSLGTVAIAAIACGSSENGAASKPDASGAPEAGIDAGTHVPSTGGASGSGGMLGTGGASGAPGPGAGGAPVGGMTGAGCALGSDMQAEPPPPGGGSSDEADATTVMDISDGGSRDAAADGAGLRDAASTDAGGGAVYPPLSFASIGRPVTVSSQFFFTEGPVWDPSAKVLYFTDINADIIYRLTLPNTFDVFAEHFGNGDGLALDPQGRLIGAGFVSRDIWRMEGSKIVSLGGQYRGRKLNSPDDLIARSDGLIYFTDPTFGIDGSQGFAAQSAELCFQGVYRMTTDGALHLEDQTTAGPNGVGLSPDEKTLYVSYTTAGEIDSFAVSADGSLGNKKRFATNVTLADSMTVDAAGNLYVASVGGITVLDPTGKRLGVISTAGQIPTNAAFGGPDLRTLFITAHALLVIVPAKGNSSLMKVEGMPIPGMPGAP